MEKHREALETALTPLRSLTYHTPLIDHWYLPPQVPQKGPGLVPNQSMNELTMPPKSKSTSSHTELKVRVSQDLMDKINTFWHDNKFNNRTDAVNALLNQSLSTPTKPKEESNT